MRIINDDLLYHIREYDIILLGSGIKNTTGNGFYRKVMLNFPYIKREIDKTAYNDPRKLGTVLEIPATDDNPIFACCHITKGRYRPDVKPDALEYDSVTKCLRYVSEKYKGKKIASTILGTSEFEGGGDRDRVLKLFEEQCSGLDITLYDFIQKDVERENAIEWHNILNLIGKISTDEYRELKKKFLWKETFGIYNEMPDLPEREIKKIIKDYKKNII